MPKAIQFNDEARKSLLEGVRVVKEAVVSTLGPKGSNVAIDMGWGPAKIVHDGVSVAREIELEDKFENMGAQLVKDAASKTNDLAGDGTTTATLLTERIFAEGLKHLSNGVNPMLLKSGIDKATKVVVDELKTYATPIANKKETESIAIISAQDAELGKTIAEAIDKVGKDGLVSVEEGRGTTTQVSYTDGMEFDKGFLSPFFITNKDRRIAEIKDAHVLITDSSISSLQQLLPFLEAFVAGQNKDLIIIADNVDSEALAFLAVNVMQKKLRAVAVRAPEFGEARQEYLEDIALLTGAKVVSTERGDKLENVVSIGDWCGKADKIEVGSDYTKIIGGNGDVDLIQQRITELRNQAENATTEFVREKTQMRLARMTSGVAVINVGAKTEVELKDRKERVIDAVSATQAAIDEGIIPGGGIALINARPAVHALIETLCCDEKAGAQIIYDVLVEPTRHIVMNAGEDPGWIIKDLSQKSRGIGYNVMTGKFVDMVKDGIVDPVKVTRLAVENASGVASMMLTTKALITDKKIEEKE